MSYYNSVGYIGSYKGNDIYVVENNQVDMRSSCWQAVRSGDGRRLRLYERGIWIGWLDNDGRVEIIRKEKPKPKVKEEPKPQTPVLLEPDEIAAQAETIVDSYLTWVEKEWWPSLDT